MIGFINLNKPQGPTSRDLVNRIQRLVRPHKVGHAGTLDPLATGVLVVAVGQATRLVEYVQRYSKTYVGEFLLGRTSPTEDITGAVEEVHDAPTPTIGGLRGAASKLTGRIWQRPPSFSALKVRGKRAYDLARRNIEVELPAREIDVHRLEIECYDYPRLVISVECGGGTYVRSLGRDLAEMVGTSAVMSALTRTSVGPFTLEQAANPALLDPTFINEHLLPAAWAVGDMPRVVLDDEQCRMLGQGRLVPCASPGGPGEEIAVLDCRERLVAIAIQEQAGWIKAAKYVGEI
jgi:tRNA pseudouridine55 synthase